MHDAMYVRPCISQGEDERGSVRMCASEAECVRTYGRLSEHLYIDAYARIRTKKRAAERPFRVVSRLHRRGAGSGFRL